ncbi:ABC transporter ATP-binding protein, partial [Staphylococcus saprophyticus]|uniref:ABC transporter ATP-binding protein n=3 Tax=Staphylococcus TaxID=1279 RepID=UPI000ED6D776
MLEIKGLSKKFKNNEKYSLKNISFQVDQGEIVGLIGKNGAGKTTLMKLIAKAIRPTDGNILINQKSILKSPNSLNDFGFMIEGSLFNHLNAIEHLKFFISLNGKVDHRENIEYVLRLVDLWEKRHINPSNFSFGMKQRLSLAICLVTEPKILILDEPFVGLDPNGVEKLIETLKQWVQKKDTAIIISSHQLSELEEICNRFLFIDNGELKEDFVLDQKDTTIIELNKSFVFTTEYKE